MKGVEQSVRRRGEEYTYMYNVQHTKTSIEPQQRDGGRTEEGEAACVRSRPP